MKCIVWIAVCVPICLAAQVRGAEESKTGPWNLKSLSRVPKTFPAEGFEAPAPCRALFFEGEPLKGKPTRVFAWYGAPADAGPNNKAPAMVLVHGGGGTAFLEWVQMWVKRGYAAIAMDTCGCVPKQQDAVEKVGQKKRRPWMRHEHGGPPGWGRFQKDVPPREQWTYHAVSAALLAHSLVRSFPEVDAERTGLTGISWGGFLTTLIVGIDSRFKFAAPVYGAGRFTKPAEWWDPATYLANAAMPILWVNGTNDFFCPPNQWQDSYRRTPGADTLCLRVRMCHSHQCGWNPPDIATFADSVLKGGKPLATISALGRDGDQARATFTSPVPIVKAEFNYTEDTGIWRERNWKIVPATLDAKAGKIVAAVPETAMAYYFNIIDDRKCTVSSEHVLTCEKANYTGPWNAPRPPKRPATAPRAKKGKGAT